MRGIAIVAAALLLSSCGRRTGIAVGSKNFTEQILLGEMAAQQLERKLRVTVDRKLGLGGTLLTHEAIVSGNIDIYPEYTGTAATVILKQHPAAEPETVYRAVRDAYAARFHLLWLPSLGFNDSFAMVVRAEDARKLAAQNLSAAESRGWRLGMGFEFLTRPDGLGRLDKVYKLRWDESPKSMDLGLLYQALKQRKVDMAAASSTDAQLTDGTFAMLEDDRKAFPPYNACYIIRSELAQAQPGAKQALESLSAKISEGVMRSLNRKVDIEHQQVERVVADFLAGQP
jgi:osmoprotectant transport system substrate-binding protein